MSRLLSPPGEQVDPLTHNPPREAYCSCVSLLLPYVQARLPLNLRWRVISRVSFLLSHSFVGLLTFFSEICPELRLTFGGGSYILSLTTYFLAAILLSSRCVLFSAFCHCLLAQLRTKHCQFSPISQSAITPSETHCFYNVSPWSCQ